MRIPVSVVVMSLLTATPFALAIRDTLNKKPVPADEDPEYDDYDASERRDRAALAEYEAEQARDKAERLEARAEKLEKLDLVFGPSPATMGALFEGAQVGSRADDDLRDKILEATEEHDGFLAPSIVADETRVLEAQVSISYSEYDHDNDTMINACDTLKDKLVKAWGRPVENVWLDKNRHVRASLEMDTCTMYFERFADPAELVASLPLTVVGTPASRLAKNHDVDMSDDRYPSWQLRGVGYGKGPVGVIATVASGKVVGLDITGETDFDTLVAIRDGLSAKLEAKPVTEEVFDADAWVWKKKPGYTLRQWDNSNRFTLTIGQSDPNL